MSSRLVTRAALAVAICALCAPGTASAAFSVVPSPNAFSGNNLLNGVSAYSSTDAWAVGSLCCSIRNSGTGALAEHWNGSTWSVVPAPDARFFDEVLNAVEDATPTNAWAVGRVKQSGYAGGTPMMLHWNGSSWQTIPPPSGVTGELRGVSRDLAGGSWAVGDDGHGHALALRCNVSACARVALPQPSTVTRLRGVRAFSPNDVWAVGDRGNETLAMHWNGAAWSVVGTPNPDAFVNVLNAVAGTGGKDVWAVGQKGRNKADTGIPPGTRTLAMHWNGTNWTEFSTPNRGDQDSLMGVAAVNPADVIAVGTFQDVAGGGGADRTLAMRWAGSSWALMSPPNVGTADNLLKAAGLIPNTPNVWAVGVQLTAGGGPTKTLILRGA